jgi:diketogulonate reductase-like aldo/keto reductase
MPEHFRNIKESVKKSLRESLQRLGRERLTLLQLHNSITRGRGDQPTSITPVDVLGKGGVLEAFSELQREGLIEHFGLTGLGEINALRETVLDAPWASIQLCIDLLHPLPELLATCRDRGIGVVAIRVLAGGALAGQPPSTHTLKTKFFPIAVFEDDQKNAAKLAARLPAGQDLKEAAIRFVLSQREVATALIGFATSEQVAEAVGMRNPGRCPTTGCKPYRLPHFRKWIAKPLRQKLAPSDYLRAQRFLVLGAAFFGWLFAGVQLGLMPLASLSVSEDLMGAAFTHARWRLVRALYRLTHVGRSDWRDSSRPVW